MQLTITTAHATTIDTIDLADFDLQKTADAATLIEWIAESVKHGLEIERQELDAAGDRPGPDITIFHDVPNPTVYLLRGITRAGKAWIEQNLEGEVILGGAFPVEHRYLGDIVDGATRDGLTIGGAQ